MSNACPHENGEQSKELYNLAIFKGKPALVRFALRSRPGFENRRFSFNNPAEPEPKRDECLICFGPARLGKEI
ncbi:MAG: hypothetical protein SCARUB_04133 [Candidatus Scalindua rubra]|uniref:Uncharacterized protein n=1 Tax=Candidatus Scalindua rubra TaxID=1872076 RepID=A0A1E3X558_9BACT|nr:MAG: hypothetical protein SCARUB_04133 [Candidatus Scalindua rubra]